MTMQLSCIVIHPMTTVHPIPASRPSHPPVSGLPCVGVLPASEAETRQ